MAGICSGGCVKAGVVELLQLLLMVKCSEPIVVAHYCPSPKQRLRTLGQPTMITIKTAPVHGVEWVWGGGGCLGHAIV